MIKPQLFHPDEVREVIARFEVPVYVAERVQLTTDDKTNPLLNTWWFSSDPEEIFADIFPTIDIYLDDGQGWDEWMRADYCKDKNIPTEDFYEDWQPFWHVGQWIDCEGVDWAEEFYDAWESYDTHLPIAKLRAKCRLALIDVVSSQSCQIDPWSMRFSNDPIFNEYLYDWESETLKSRVARST